MGVLDAIQRTRVEFDPANKEHVEEFRYFVVNHKWKAGCPFDLVWPYLSIPDMIKDKIISYHLKI